MKKETLTDLNETIKAAHEGGNSQAIDMVQEIRIRKSRRKPEEEGHRNMSASSVERSQAHPRRALCMPLDGIPGSLNYNDPLPSH